MALALIGSDRRLTETFVRTGSCDLPYSRAAFAYRVDLVLHPNDLPRFEEALERSKAETEIRYRVLKESLRAMGKAC